MCMQHFVWLHKGSQLEPDPPSYLTMIEHNGRSLELDSTKFCKQRAALAMYMNTQGFGMCTQGTVMYM